LAPCGSTIPYSASRPRVWLIKEVRLWTKRSRMRWSDCRSWHLRLFTGTNCIVGRPAASKIACASVASFLDPRTKGLTKKPPGLLKHAPPMMSAAAGLHSDDLRIEPIDGRDQLQAADLP
jgi:hypothetical protein